MGLTYELDKVLEKAKVTSPVTAIPSNETETWEIYDDVMSRLVVLCFKYTTVEWVFQGLKQYIMDQLIRFGPGQCRHYRVLFDIPDYRV